MYVLLLGNGGREDALFQHLKNEEIISKLWIAPGNAGQDDPFTISDLDILDFAKISEYIYKYIIQLVIIGPENLLALGIKDFLEKSNPNVLVFGPNKLGAKLEASKSFAYEIACKHNMPIGQSVIVENLDEAKKCIENSNLPIVIKIDGLAAGKGVTIHQDRAIAIKEVESIFKNNTLNQLHNKLLIQEFLVGKEASVFVMCNGEEGIFLPIAQDYKNINDNNLGDNTGGMGSYALAHILTEEQLGSIYTTIVKPILREFHYTGVLYIGLMVHSHKKDDYSIIEFNVRFGDPEIQVVLPLLSKNIFSYILWSVNYIKDVVKIKNQYNYLYVPYDNSYVVNVVIAAKGYPEKYKIPILFTLPDDSKSEGIQIIHAGTKKSIMSENIQYESTGGRIINIIGKGATLEKAREDVYNYIKCFQELNSDIQKDVHYRTDIAKI